MKDKRCLRDIQEEEGSLREEADFLEWWSKKEERANKEVEALAREGFRSERERERVEVRRRRGEVGGVDRAVVVGMIDRRSVREGPVGSLNFMFMDFFCSCFS